MSADNWARCPKCWDDATKAYEAEYARVMASYGQVPVDEFDAARAALTKPDEEEFPKTFREDYDFYGAEGGEVKGSYKGGCSACGLSVRVVTSKRFYPEEVAES